MNQILKRSQGEPKWQIFLLGLGLTVILSLLVGTKSVWGLPPPEDTPEEILRTEIITEARSPVDGKPLTAAEYAELQAQLAARPGPPKLSPEVRDRIFLLRLRDALLRIFPFLPI